MIEFLAGNIFVMANQRFCRRVEFSAHGLRTTSVLDRESGLEYITDDQVPEFSFALNGEVISSYSYSTLSDLDGNVQESTCAFTLAGAKKSSGPAGSEILQLDFALRTQPLHFSVFYQLYPDLKGCVKWLSFSSQGPELRLTALALEQFNLAPGRAVDLEYRLGPGFHPVGPMFTTTGSDDIVLAYDESTRAGFWVGTSIPGPMRYFMCYPHWPSGLLCGYSRSTAAFCKYLRPGESFVSAEVFLATFQGDCCAAAQRNEFRRLLRRHLPSCADPGGIMYCTWLPFHKSISEKLVSDLAEKAADLQFQTLVLDDGWFTDQQWAVDAEKFPGGLEPLAEKVRSLGLRFGLWFNIGTDYGNPGSRPEDNCLLPTGEVKPFSRNLSCRCLASKHRDWLVEKLCALAGQYGLGYYKLDFSSIISPYGIMPPGCSGTEHAYHKNAADAVQEQYQSMYYIRQEIKQRFPDLLLDFSFESYGTEFPNISALQYSELHHSSNMSTNSSALDMNARKIRQQLYRYCLVLPAERILGSLICLSGENDVEHLYTAFVGVPLVAGNLLAISEQDAALIRRISQAYHGQLAGGPLTEFYLLNGDPRPARYDWDGFLKTNTAGEGILCVFRNDSTDTQCEFTVPADLPARIMLEDMASGEAAGSAQPGQRICIPFQACTSRGFVVRKA